MTKGDTMCIPISIYPNIWLYWSLLQQTGIYNSTCMFAHNHYKWSTWHVLWCLALTCCTLSVQLTHVHELKDSEVGTTAAQAMWSWFLVPPCLQNVFIHLLKEGYDLAASQDSKTTMGSAAQDHKPLFCYCWRNSIRLSETDCLCRWMKHYSFIFL